jgi:glutamate synthase domain-containing protein 2
MRILIFSILFFLLVLCAIIAFVFPVFWILFGLLVIFTLMATADAMQTRQAVLRNFPLIGRMRYLLEAIRPEINQYFVESNTDGVPFSREQRSLVYQRAKGQLDTVPFGTLQDVYAPGYEWLAHSIGAIHLDKAATPTVTIGGRQCTQPYDAALLNVSAMSFGSLSSNAIEALNKGARIGGFYHNTGEGGISSYHLKHGGDLVWQIGTGYFGCRTRAGGFDLEAFRQRALDPQVKMIEIKLSQGAKPGHGGILPGRKVTQEIANVRGVPLGQDVLSPPSHQTFGTPRELCAWVAEVRELAGGKPVGIKLCVGQPVELMGLAKAMRETGNLPDFIAIDGGEGGTGAAPLEFSNSVGMPLREAIVLTHNILVGFDLRDSIRLIAAGKVISAFDMAVRLALGADLVCSARAMMLALGCIQARRCNSNDCPVGVATQKPSLVSGLDVEDKARRVAAFQRETVQGLMELLGSAALESPTQLTPGHILRRLRTGQVGSLADLHDSIERGSLLFDPVPEFLRSDWERASPDFFDPARDAPCAT